MDQDWVKLFKTGRSSSQTERVGRSGNRRYLIFQHDEKDCASLILHSFWNDILSNWTKSFLDSMCIEIIGQNVKFYIVISFSKLNLRVFLVAYDLQGCLETGLISSNRSHVSLKFWQEKSCKFLRSLSGLLIYM